MLENREETIVKTARHPSDDLRCEAVALRWLATAEKSGSIHAASVIEADEHSLVEERIRLAAPTRDAARRAGAALARMHAAGAGWFGCPPDGWAGDMPHGYPLDGSLTPLVPKKDAPASWGSYYAEYRIMPFTRQLRDRGVLEREETRVLERVAARLARGDFDAGQPTLVRAGGHAAARLHGDLWAGNLLWDAKRAGTCGASVIDPMAHGGHAETDLAMLQLFGCAHLADLLDGYNEVSPLAGGWRERVGLHQLSPLLHHCILFGRSYVPETLAAARKYL